MKMKWMKYALDWLKTPPCYFAPVALFCGFVLFVPAKMLEPFGWDGLRQIGKPYLGAAFLLSISILGCAVIRMGAVSAWAKCRQWFWIRHGIRHLKKLTPDEQTILRNYLENSTRSCRLDFKNGVVVGLEHAMIIHRVSRLGDPGQFREVFFSFNMQPWAWDYLNNHPELVGIVHRKTS